MQRTFDDLGTPLCDVTFCVVDLETTGGSPATCEITEVGAVKLRGGVCLGTLQTLVNPRMPIPPSITVLTGITDAMVIPAPPIEEVLPSLLEFARGCVLVGHNVRFDLSFLQAALARAGYPRLDLPVVDTCALARRLVRDEVPNCRLGTLAQRFRLSHQPRHRALEDALATGELLHLLLERAGTLGVLGLDDLLSLPTIVGHPQAGKLKMTARLPRAPGVYLFRDPGGRVLYVGKATNLRRRVRSYFSGDDRRKVGQLVRELAAVDHIVCRTPLEAAVLEVRLIHEHQPRFNRQAKLWRKYAYVKLTLDERFPRLAVVRVPKLDDGCVYLGPLPSHRFARHVVDAIEAASPIRRCTGRAGVARKPAREAPCAPAQLGVATCPCAEQVSQAEYAGIVEQVRLGLTSDPSLLLDPLAARMHALAAAERFEEAADVRDRAAALSAALRRQRRLDGMRRAGRLVLEVSGATALLAHGRLVDTWDGGDERSPPLLGLDDQDHPATPLRRDLADEVACVAAWIEAHAHRIRLVSCDGELTSPLPALPSFEPARGPAAG